MKKFLQKLTAALLAVSLTAACSLPALAAEGKISKDETVYLILNNDGSVKEQIVSDWLHSDSGLRDVRDASSLTEIENLKSETKPVQKDGALLWDTDEKDLYYQGKSTAEPPVSVKISYELDGKELSASELEGKSGKLSIHISLENNRGKEQIIDGKKRTVYTPFFTICAALLPSDSFQNVTAEHGTVQTDSKNELACFLALPGVSESLDGLIPEGMEKLNSYLLDDLRIEADVTDCPVPTFLFAASPSLEGLSLENTELSDKLGELQDATRQLQDGVGALDKAVGTLQEKLGELAEGYAQFDAGVDAALDGSKQLQDGGVNLLESAELLFSKTGELAGGAAQLRDGAVQLSGTLNSQLVPALGTASTQKAALQEKMTYLTNQLNTLTVPDVSGLKGQLASSVGQVFDSAAYNGAYYAAQAVGDQTGEAVGSAVKSGCQQVVAAAAPQIQESYKQTVGGILAQAGLDSGTQAAVLSAMDQYITADTISGAINGAIDANVTIPSNAVSGTAVKNGGSAGTDAEEAVQTEDIAAKAAQQTVAGMADAKKQVISQVSAAVPDIDAEQYKALISQFQGLSWEANNMLTQVDVLTAALYNSSDPTDQSTVVGAANALAIGSQTLSDGAAALSGGAGAFAGGVGQLSGGASDLYDGLSTLSSSSKTVADSISQFQSGSAELKDGSSQLKEGMDAFADEAIRKLADMADPDSALGQTLTAMLDQAEAYEGMGRGKDMELTVKYVMRTEAPAASGQPEPSEEPEESGIKQEEGNLWERIKGLFS